MLFSVALRSVLVFQNSPLLDRVLLLLFLWLPALLADILYGRQLRWLAVLSISMEFLLTQYLLLVTQTDFFAFLFAIPCMQVMQRFSYKAATALVALSTLLIFLTLLQPYSLPFSLATAVVYFGGSLFLVTYIESIRRAGAIEEQQQVLAMQLKQANDQMVLYSSQRKQLAAVRERQRLVRELHDSVTQTIFSMTLTTQSALMLLDHDRNQVAVLLDRLDHLTHNVLTEMQILISRLGPESLTANGFTGAILEHIAERGRIDNLSVQLEVSGVQPLTAMEEQGLFRIVQEGLNNVVKHAGAAQAVVRLHLEGQPYLEVEDYGIGFDPQLVHPGSGMGLANMKDRAREIGWSLCVKSSPGNGTRIQVWKETGG